LGLQAYADIGLNRKAGRMLKRAKVVLRRAWFRVGSSSLGSKSITKKAASSGFGEANGRLLVTRAIPGLLSLAAANGPTSSSPGPVPAYSGLKSSVKAFGFDAFVVMGSATLGSVSLVAAFGLVPTSSSPVLESSGPKSSVHASLPFDQASSEQPIAPAFFLGIDLAFKVDSANEGSFLVGFSFGATSSGAAALGGRLRFSLPVMSKCEAPIYPSESKSVLRYYRRSKVGRGAQLDASLIDKALTAISALMALPFGAQPLSEPGGGC